MIYLGKQEPNLTLRHPQLDQMSGKRGGFRVGTVLPDILKCPTDYLRTSSLRSGPIHW
jgi:hypothetical protein